MTRIAGILLAAGRGTRFGGAKLLAPLAAAGNVSAGTPVGVAAAEHLAAALPGSIAVVRPDDVELSERLRAVGLQVVRCGNADLGMGASLASGVAATKAANGWIIALADMPWIAPATIRSVAAAVASGAELVAPVYHGRRGHPVGFARSHYRTLVGLTGDAGARVLLERHPDRLTLVDVDDPAILRDVDTPADLAPPA